MLDLGCGDGTFLIEMCASIPGVEGVGVDLSSEAVSSGREKVADHGLTKRISLFEKDVLELSGAAEELKGVDAATVFFVFHEFLTNTEDRLVEFLRRFREQFPKTDLLVCEAVWHDLEELPRPPGPIAEYQLFHRISGQRLVNLQTWRRLFSRAGFSDVEETYLAFVRTVIFLLRGEGTGAGGKQRVT